MSLQQFINAKNRLNELLDRPLLKTPTNAKSCRAMYQMIGDDLSPENLTCDGERDPAQVQSTERVLNRAWHELDIIWDGLF